MTNQNCNCDPTYMGECGNCAGNKEGCFLCENGFVEVSQSEYEVDKNTERPFLVVHQKSCQTTRRKIPRQRKRRF